MDTQQASPKIRSRATIPARCHPFAKIAFSEMGKHGISYDEVVASSGIGRRVLRSWRGAKNPGLESGAAVLGSLGCALLPIPRVDRVPPAIVASLAELSKTYSGETPLLNLLIASACGVPLPVEPTRAA